MFTLCIILSRGLFEIYITTKHIADSIHSNHMTLFPFWVISWMVQRRLYLSSRGYMIFRRLLFRRLLFFPSLSCVFDGVLLIYIFYTFFFTVERISNSLNILAFDLWCFLYETHFLVISHYYYFHPLSLIYCTWVKFTS